MSDQNIEERVNARVEQETPRSVRCRRCRADITILEARISMSGSHEHFFRNPAGIRFRVACFAYAPGAITFGELTEEHTWFPPYAWQLALCRTCAEHIGWHYAGEEGKSFFGLIVDRLIYPNEG